ncbi:hypothetical protein H9L10_08890 [Phycicoccus endophyticus]|uniref:Uncharacterized protein n=1 Tax=Phycicoccus endophyticus TaxID=1690220 RepID=A0A7G9QYN0_9MICO|nr:hypothetical protein [Phycicoccus endophyticus]NHI20511.1 hypothetical protein [Phycicoccus endophyticus]QNN48455.1 hypothetical protein H9L10_08890 [Phycicoccus endophyticus]GGL30153.1 hypothetical protein GCM10012283_10660 [Phycicoccus endophyticus]
METALVDPRDQTWEIEDPVFRVYFHDQRGTSSEYEVRGAQVDEVLDWAARVADGRTFVLYVCVPDEGIGLVRLLGQDPNAA